MEQGAKFMSGQTNHMPEWLSRLLFYWGVGAFLVACFFLLIAFFHIALFGALLGAVFFVGSYVKEFFVKSKKMKSPKQGRVIEHEDQHR